MNNLMPSETWPRQRPEDGVLRIHPKEYLLLRKRLNRASATYIPKLWPDMPIPSQDTSTGIIWAWLAGNGYAPESFAFKETRIEIVWQPAD